ncbi:MAG: ABC transporter ATP-binding protein [Planctomycetota bacterium]
MIPAMADVVLETRSLKKSFGKVHALTGVELSVKRGDLYGFLGQNGAGKTTAIRILGKLVRPSSGSATLLGMDVGSTPPTELLSRVGFLVESPAFFPYLTGGDNLLLHARLLGLKSAAKSCGTMAARFGLKDTVGRRVSEYSLGMKQRLGIAQALLGDPELLILDEPTNGLDPSGIARVREILREECRERGRTVFLSSHMLSEVELLCGKVAVLHEGRVIAEGSVASLLMEGERVRIRTSDPKLSGTIVLRLGLERADSSGPDLVLHGNDEQVASVVRALIDGGVEIHEVTRQRRSLEDVYRDLTRQEASWQES